MERKSIGKRILFFGIILVMLVSIGLTIDGAEWVKAAVVYMMAVDDDGADDEPGQKDLNFLEYGIDPLVASTLYVNWGFDDTAWTGTNTGDACVLLDNDANGFADYAYCVSLGTIDGVTQIVGDFMYTCDDTSAFNCDGATLMLSESSAELDIAMVDPFGDLGGPYYDPDHTGNVCSDTPGCITYDAYVQTEVDITGLGGAKLLNVCSYPSASRPSKPSDCVYTPGAGFLKIVKVAEPDTPIDFVFNLGAGQESTNGDSSWTITGSGEISYIPFVAGTTYDLSEVVPFGWELFDASCELQDATPAPTGTWSGTTITDFTIQMGLTTECTFTNRAQVDLTVTKTDGDYTTPYTHYRGGWIDYVITVINDGTYAATGVVVEDILDVNLTVTDPIGAVITRDVDGTPTIDPAICTWATGPVGSGGTITCPLTGDMAAGEATTIAFTAYVSEATPIGNLIEYGTCTQNPNKQDGMDVDVCNVVSVSGTNEAFGLQDNNSDSEPTDIGKPTAVELISFEAVGQKGSILLTWTVGSETDTLGYNLYRAASLKGKRTLLNEAPIFADGGPYEYEDVVKSRNTFYYWLESVDLSGGSTIYDIVPSAKALK